MSSNSSNSSSTNIANTKLAAQRGLKPQPKVTNINKTTSKTIAGQLANTCEVLHLKQSHVTFEAPSQKVSVFFDECNQEVISLTSGIESNKTRVLFQSTTDQPTNYDSNPQFVLPVEKRILSIKLNSTRSVLAYHVEKSNIEFINVKTIDNNTGCSSGRSYSLDDRRYVQASRTKNSKLFGFLWTGPLELVMITDISIEYYHVDTQRRRLRPIKSFQSSTNWFVYQPQTLRHGENATNSSDSNIYSILMVSTGSVGNSMQPYMFSRKQIVKLMRFDVEGYSQGSDKLELFERSITIASIYGYVRLLVLQHESLNVKSRGAQILIYTVDHESGSTSKTHTLDLDVSGRFAINILDNLVIAHDQPSKTSFIFDIMIESTEKSDCPKHFVSLLESRPIRQLRIDGKDDSKPIEMYSLNWVFFQPNFIIDAKMGLLSTLRLDLRAFQESIQDNLLLLSFLAQRANSEQIILSRCKEIVACSLKTATKTPPIEGNPLADVSSAFEILSKLIISAPELGKMTGTDEKQSVKTKQIEGKAAVSQDDVYREVFRQLESNTDESPSHLHFVSSTLLEFIFLVRKREKNVEFCIYEQLMKCLVRGKRFYQMVQMIRSQIFKDSKQLACLLLSLRDQYKPATQLGLDMLSRLDCLTELVESMSLSPEGMSLAAETASRSSVTLVQNEVEAS